tara:strand:+ start:198 stop:359 length:162 start_codon:yes stop_codon:yes gene_type:complete
MTILETGSMTLAESQHCNASQKTGYSSNIFYQTQRVAYDTTTLQHIEQELKNI